MTNQVAVSREWLEGGGEVGERVRRYDWAKTPFGPRDTWPNALREAVRQILHTIDGDGGSAPDLHTALVEAKEAERRKDEFLAILAHELRNPLAAISLAVQVVRRKLPDHADPRQLDIIERQARALARMVDDLLDVSRIARGTVELQVERIDLSKVLARALDASRSVIESRKHTVSVETPPDAVLVEADPVRIEQIIVNLVTNAAKYTEPGGSISVALERARREHGGCAVLRISDNGIGIGPDLRPRLFQLYQQGRAGLSRSPGGLGIGLTLVRRLAELHGGTVDAASEGPGRGSTFTVQLPLAE